MNCPKDQAELHADVYESDVTVEGCQFCGGVWLDDGELRRIEESSENDYSEELARMPELGYQAYELAQAKDGRSLQCPNCGGDMEALEYARCSQVLVDVCTKCSGVWLDEGELRSLEVFFERSRAESREIRHGFLASLRSLFSGR